MSTPSPWEHFSLEELTCHCGCGQMKMNADFMDLMVKVRKYWGKVIIVTSAYRCPAWDAKVGTSFHPGKGPHTTGHAMDVSIYGADVLEFLDALRKIGGFTGVGLSQKEGSKPSERFIHIDNLTEIEAEALRPNCWTY